MSPAAEAGTEGGVAVCARAGSTTNERASALSAASFTKERLRQILFIASKKCKECAGSCLALSDSGLCEIEISG